MITITDNGNGSILFNDGSPRYIQKNKVANVDAVNDGVIIRMKSKKEHRIDSYTLVSGYTSAIELAEAINTLIQEESCPTITIGSINFAGGATPIVGESIQGGALISGGVAPYTLGTVTGDVPGGLTPGVFENAGNWFFVLIGTPTTFGVYTFTVTVLDDNGCESTPKEFTVLVGESFENTTPVPITDESAMDVVVSGLTGTLGVDVEILDVEVNVTSDVLDLLGSAIAQVTSMNGVSLFSNGQLTGSNLTDCVFSPNSATPITSGSAPYTGSWQKDFSNFNGVSPNDTYQLQVLYDVGAGTIDSCKITFIPII